MASAVDLSRKSLVVITGASQGIGRTLAIELSKHLDKDSKIILIARSEARLKETEELIHKVNKEITVRIVPLDLTKPDPEEYEGILDQDLQADQALLFHNVGQVGKLSDAIDLNDLQVWRDYYDLNFFSVGILNGILVKKFKNVVKKLVVVNISSLTGCQPFTNMALYGSSRAARQLYFRVFAIEEPDVTVLNYCPGAVDTAIYYEILHKTENDHLRVALIEMKEKSLLLTTHQTVKRLLSILICGNFKSGDVIDYDPNNILC